MCAARARNGTRAWGSLQTYGATVDQLHAPFGAAVDLKTLEVALHSKSYKLVAFTHVDTSTGAHPRPPVSIVLVD